MRMTGVGSWIDFFSWLSGNNQPKTKSNEQEAYELGVAAYDKGYHAEDNPFSHGTPQFIAWESGFEDQIYLEHGIDGLDRYNNNY